GAPAREVFAATLDARNPDDLGWHDASVAVAQAAQACRLRLHATSDRRDAGAPLWAVPRVVSSPLRERESRPTSVVLISLDTLRGDHLSSNGYGRVTSPEIDRLLVARGSSFADVSTTYPMTNYAHLGMFTGLYPAALPRNGTLPPDVSVRMLAEVLRDAGFETVAFTEDTLVGGVYGFWFGFDRFTERSVEPRDRGDRTFADGMRYAREHRDRKFFLWLHTYKTHGPYTAGERYRSLFVSSQATDGAGAEPVGADVPAAHRAEFDEYDRTIREADDLVAGLVAELERLGLLERTLVVLVS